MVDLIGETVLFLETEGVATAFFLAVAGMLLLHTAFQETAWERLVFSGLAVVAIFLANPTNPIGYIMSMGAGGLMFFLLLPIILGIIRAYGKR